MMYMHHAFVESVPDKRIRHCHWWKSVPDICFGMSTPLSCRRGKARPHFADARHGTLIREILSGTPSRHVPLTSCCGDPRRILLICIATRALNESSCHSTLHSGLVGKACFSAPRVVFLCLQSVLHAPSRSWTSDRVVVVVVVLAKMLPPSGSRRPRVHKLSAYASQLLLLHPLLLFIRLGCPRGLAIPANRGRLAVSSHTNATLSPVSSIVHHVFPSKKLVQPVFCTCARPSSTTVGPAGTISSLSFLLSSLLFHLLCVPSEGSFTRLQTLRV